MRLRTAFQAGAVMLVLAGTARAQTGLLDEQADPGMAAQDLRRILAQSLPGDWTVSEPQTISGAPQVVIGIPLGGAEMLRIVVRHRNHDLMPYDCRP
jgi:hypothetical protein